LNERGLPFRLKLVNEPHSYARTDAAVLYFRRDHYDDVSPILESAYRQIEPFLRDPVSWFAKRLEKGVSLAEDPGEGISFGQHRSDLLASALSAQSVSEAGDSESRYTAVTAGLEQSGLSLTAPYLSPGSSDIYRTIDT
ncbi:MAG: hypothetical protein HY678_10865, partial [Chloroflexi bacterium]|nr:hypothetical protein [Chloroflexota bacterium]